MKAKLNTGTKALQEVQPQYPDTKRVNDLISTVACAVSEAHSKDFTNESRWDEYFEIYFQDVPKNVVDHCLTIIARNYERAHKC